MIKCLFSHISRQEEWKKLGFASRKVNTELFARFRKSCDEFFAKTAYCSVLLSVALSLFERIFPMNQPFTNQPMLEVMFAIALPALGSAILFNIGHLSMPSENDGLFK